LLSSEQVDCAMLPHLLLLGDWVENLDIHIPFLLDKIGIDVLVYSGEIDFSKNNHKQQKQTSN
jgi:hypothetical protein